MKGSRKRTRRLTYSPSENAVFRDVQDSSVIVVTVNDRAEPDRLHRLEMSEDEALRLAARLAHQVRGKVVLDSLRGDPR